MLIEPLHQRDRDSMALGALLEQGWPPFISADLEAAELMPQVRTLFADLELLALDSNRYVGAGWAVPLHWDGTAEDLPAGYTDSLHRAVALVNLDPLPNTMVVCAIQVDQEHQGRGVAAKLITEFRALARRRGFDRLIIPLRPIMKSKYPLTPIDQYACWIRGDGAPFDPWLRLHCRLGAEVIAMAPESQTMTGSVADWERWTSLALPGPGHYIIPDGLVPLAVGEDLSGRYVEPNVWIQHPLS